MQTAFSLIAVGFCLVGLGAVTILLVGLARRLRNRTDELDQLKKQVLEWNRRLEDQVTDRTKILEIMNGRLQETYLETVTALVEVFSAKDPYLYNHAHNVALYAKAIAEELGFSPERIERLIQGCKLHDLGKIAIPDSILSKQGPLTPEEFEVIKEHPTRGARILEPLTFLKDVTEMVEQEHERWDGSGYPRGLKGEQIRLEARLIAVADTLDAMTSDRPYRKRLGLEEACAELKRCSGTQFESRVVEACLRAVAEGRLKTAAGKADSPSESSGH